MHRMSIRGTLAALSLVAVFGLAGCNTPGGGTAGVAPGGSTAPSTQSTVDKVKQALTKDSTLTGQTITVTENGGSIVLDGTVATIAQKDAAEKVVRDVQTADKLQPAVLNNLLVQEAGTAPEGGTKGDNH